MHVATAARATRSVVAVLASLAVADGRRGWHRQRQLDPCTQQIRLRHPDGHGRQLPA